MNLYSELSKVTLQQLFLRRKTMTKTFKTSSTYRAARKQQKTAYRKTFYDEIDRKSTRLNSSHIL